MIRYFLIVVVLAFGTGCEAFFSPLDLDLERDAGSVDASVDLDAEVSDMGPTDATATDATATDSGDESDAAEPIDSEIADTCIPSLELCGDGIDNDCDTETDEGFGEIGTPCDSIDDTDSCNDGTFVCSDGVVVCEDGPANVSAEEVCNGNYPASCVDLAGLGFLADLGTRCDPDGPMGACEVGMIVCNAENDGTVCDAVLRPEVCDGIDNNCDGSIDEGFNIGDVCTTQNDCPGTLQCDGTGGNACITNPNATEICDGIDNNCDGDIDENFGVGDTCTGPFGCSGTRQCTSANESSCVSNDVEVCDGLDNDCDGIVDNRCDDDGDGFCDATIAWASGASATCQFGGGDCLDTPMIGENFYPGAPELCDLADNDCNGSVDDGAPVVNDDYDMPIPNNTASTATIVTGSPYSATGTPLQLAGVTRLVAGDVDWFQYSHNFMSATSGVEFLCRVSTLTAAQTVQLQLTATDSNGPITQTSAALGNNGVFGLSDRRTLSGDYTMQARVSPASGLNGCDNDYVLECKARPATGSPSTW